MADEEQLRDHYPNIFLPSNTLLGHYPSRNPLAWG
jgi:hypothetical protein